MEERLVSNYQYQYEYEVASTLAQQFKAEKNSEEKTESSWKIVFLKENKVQFLLVLLLNFLNQATGINFQVLYSTDILTKMNFKNASRITLSLGFMNMLGGVAASVISGKTGFKKLLVGGMFMQGVAYIIYLFGYVEEYPSVVILGAHLYMLCFAMSLGASLYPYQSAILEPAGIGIGSLPQWLMSLIISKFGLKIMEIFEVFYVFYFCMLMCLLGAIVIQIYGVEIVGKSFLQIKKEFGERSNK